MLVALLSLPNELVYIQFHPVCYMVKLNIEMSMASLITRLATGKSDANYSSQSGLGYANNRPTMGGTMFHNKGKSDVGLKYLAQSKSKLDTVEEITGDKGGINRRDDYEVTIHQESPSSTMGRRHSTPRVWMKDMEDEMSLTSNPGHPRAA